MQHNAATQHKTWLKLAVFIGTTIICFAVSELVLRAFGYHGETFFRIENTVPVDDPVLNWRYVPNTLSYFNDIDYRINERGFRDYVYPYAKKAKTLRIFLASDSVGFGTNVQMTDSYPKLLESKLNSSHLPFQVEVLNYSMPGLSIKQKIHLVEMYANKYEPDLIVVDYVVNDIEFESKKKPAEEKNVECSIEIVDVRIPCPLKAYLKRSAFLFFAKEAVENILHKINWEQHNHFYDQVEGDYYHRLYSLPEKRKYLKTIFRQIGKYQKEKGVQIIIPIFPLIYDYNNYKWQDINELIVNLCKENDLIYISLLDAYKKFPYNQLRVQRGDFTHPSVKGNAMAADLIARTMVNMNLLVVGKRL